MLTNKVLYRLVWIPMALLAIGISVHGGMWMVLSEPWLLDQAANEVLLQTSYDKIFEMTATARLGDYLTALYRFFGFWILLIGLLMGFYMVVTRLENEPSRKYLHVFIVIALVGLYYFQYKFIPISPFLWTSHSMLFALVLSNLASRKLAK